MLNNCNVGAFQQPHPTSLPTCLQAVDINIETQVEVLTLAFRQYSQQNQKLTHLYQLARLRNEQLSKINCKITKDIDFLRHYCFSLEHQLDLLGYYKNDKEDLLSRKETAEGIFLCYNESLSSLTQELSEEELQSELLYLRNSNFNLQSENSCLKLQLQRKQRSVSREVQVNIYDTWQKAYEVSDDRANRLEKQVKELRRQNESLQIQKARKGITNFILKDRQQLFAPIHDLISEYKQKIKNLASQKKDIEKKYKVLRQKINQFDHNNEYKLIQLYSEKIDILQKLTQKQQLEIQNTIQLYQVELKKIQERRREEIDSYQNQRLDLQSQNLRLCIDLQRSLNNGDNAALTLIQQKNRNECLHKEIDNYKKTILELRENIKILQTNKQLSFSGQNVSCLIKPIQKVKVKCLQQGVETDPQQNLQKMVYVNGRKLTSSGIIHPNKAGDQNSNTQNYQYQYSQMEQKDKINQKMEEIKVVLPSQSSKRQSSHKKSAHKKITITYGQPYIYRPNYVKVHKISSRQKLLMQSNSNKSYDSVLQYKKRFIERKPEACSFNQ